MMEDRYSQLRVRDLKIQLPSTTDVGIGRETAMKFCNIQM